MNQNFIARYRIGVSRLFFVGLIGVALFNGSLLPATQGVRLATLIISSAFVIVAVLGRLWCSLYLCGYKTKSLIDIGPFSAVRNPLYIFSFIGATGIGIATTSMVITLMVATFFLVVYPSVIANEEKRLTASLGHDYQIYLGRTPKLIPDFSLYKSVDQYTVNMRQVHSAFLDVVWFFVALGCARLIPLLHDAQILPLQL